ncbi:ComEC family competence protein [Aggregatimonas sangjinii]|uniref:ComEC family competence protein n=1 Tax=Aggregatimonas sangjinii TaxID=2583587 RepID=A0A5B7SNY8_9FLAO|nr:ComEC/Rec2 family competence protein [Aggregatimonas sangjinii]QCW98722.1 ComEC family competence protein [Aggregatimonas sangjinii]
MRLLRFIPIQLTLFLVFGIVLGNFFGFGIVVPLVGTLVFLAILGFLSYTDIRKTTPVFAFTTALLTISIGSLAISIANPKNLASHYTHTVNEGSHVFHLKVIEILKPTSFSNRYLATLKAVDGAYRTGKLLISMPTDTIKSSIQIDDELFIHGNLLEVNGPLNPHQFNYKSYMEDLGIFHQLRVGASGTVVVTPTSRTIYGRAAALRRHIISKLRKADFGEAELSIIQALLLGQRNDISEETYNDYKNAGAVHILAVSGLHIGILLLLLQFLLKPLELLPTGKTIKLVVIVSLLWGFALLAGFSASIIRAVTMFSFVAYAMTLNRPSNTFNILSLSMFFILLVIDPKLLFQVGFQMSYAAVFAIVWIYPLLQQLWYPRNIVVRKIWQLLSVSIAAQTGVLPISLYYFHQFPGLFFISNLLIVPALGIIFGIGILVILLALCNRLPNQLTTLYDMLIRWMNTIIAWVAEQEAFVFQHISFDAVQLVLAYGLLIGGLVFLTKPAFKKAVVAAVAMIGFQGYIMYVTYQTKEEEALLVLHQTANSVLLHQAGAALSVFSKDSSKIDRMVADYRTAERIASINNKPLSNSYKWKNNSVLIIDSTGVYPQTPIDYLLLTESPQINLERLIDSLRPKRIIADGSNFRSYAARWKQTCLNRKLPFHYTGEKGAYYFE